MKNILVLLIIILVFFICATVGYNLATQTNLGRVESQAVLSGDPLSQQNRLIIVVVESMDQAQARLLSVWFVSLFSINPDPPMLTFAQLYSPASTSSLSQSLSDGFALNTNGEPAAAFWRAMRKHNFQWDNFIVIDLQAVRQIMEWMFSQPLTNEAVAGIFASPEQSQQLVQVICQTLPSLSARPAGGVSWRELVPGHFRSDIRLEDGLVYWEQTIRSGPITRCEMLPTP